MKRIKTWLLNLQPFKILSIFLVVTFLMLAQACNRSSVAGEPPQLPDKIPNMRIYNPKKDNAIFPKQGEMNNFSDVDVRDQETEQLTRYKGDEGIENVQKNLQNKETPFDKQLENSETTNKDSERGIGNIQENSDRKINNLTRNLQNRIQDIERKIQRQVEDTGEPLNRSVIQSDSN